MDSDSIEVSLLGGDISSELLSGDYPTSVYPDVVADRDREGIYDVLHVDVGLFQEHPYLQEEIIDKLLQGMGSPAEAGFAQHVGDQFRFFHEIHGLSEVTCELYCGNQHSCYHLRIAHLGSGILFMAYCLEEIVYYGV